jgi:hypothetical protein
MQSKPLTAIPAATVQNQPDKVLHDLEHLWAKMDDLTKKSGKARIPMTFEQMNEAKARRVW